MSKAGSSLPYAIPSQNEQALWVRVPETPVTCIWETGGSQMKLHSIKVSGFLGKAPEYHGLLGRDLLAHYHFEMTHCARFELR